MYVLITHELNEHDVKNKYIQVDDEFLTVIKWTADVSKAKVFDTMLAAELFVKNNAGYLVKNLPGYDIFVAELVPNIRYFLGNTGKHKVDS